MHITRCPVRFFLILTLLLVAVDQRTSRAAEEPVRTPRVVGMVGRVQFSRETGVFAPLLNGTELRPGDVVRTAVASAVDLDLGSGPGIVRLTESSTLTLDKLPTGQTNSADGGTALEISLGAGELLGQCKASPAGSRFEIKTPLGIAQILHGQFRVQSRGYIVLVDGKLLFAHVPPGGQPSAHTLSAPPACYFTPVAGVRPAPKELVREVKNQWKAKLDK
jgi:hypothetical protein